MVVGENGVLSRATNATKETSQAEAKQELESALMDAQTDFATTTWKNNNAAYFMPGYLKDKTSLTSSEYIITLSGSDYVASTHEWILGTIQKKVSSGENKNTIYHFKIVPKGQMGAAVDTFQVDEIADE